MLDIKIPGLLNFGKKFGLMISDDEVSIITWKRGEIERLALFKNDDSGVARFIDHLRANEETYKGKGFHVLTNIIGEDYRFEKIAHLIGKYKTDFHARRMSLLFRNATLRFSEVQGREERGRREDWVLFFGLLTEGKVMPWINALSRGDRFLAGVSAVSFVVRPLLRRLQVGGGAGNQLLITLHENNLMRQTFYVNGNLRFSRVSKINAETAESLASSMKKELERTLQYLTSLKISIKDGISVQFVSPSQMVGQLRELLKSGERIRFVFHDVEDLARKEGLVFTGDTGKDSSLALHLMFSYFRVSQLAPVSRIQFYWISLFAKIMTTMFLLYGLSVYSLIGVSFSKAYLDYGSVNSKLIDKVEELRINYEREVSGFKPASSPINMQAVTDTFDAISRIDTSPTRLIYYVAQGLAKNSNIYLENMKWSISNEQTGAGNPSEAPVSGRDLYQILEIEGEFLEIQNETYVDVAARATKLLKSFEDRTDIHLVPVLVPSKELASDNLQGSLEEGYAVDAAQERNFIIRFIWKEYGENSLKGFADEA